MRPFLLACAALALSMQSMCMVACASTDETNLADKGEAVKVTVSDGFASTLFRETAKNLKGNVVVSPYSVSSALSMAYGGALGTTKTQMQSVLDYKDMTDEAVNDQNMKLSKSLSQVNPLSELTVANAMFAKQGVEFKKAFIDTNQKYFGAKLETLDFSDPSTVTKINDWVKDKTKDKIPGILDKIPNDAVLYLVNAIYFKGTWLDEFKKDETRDAKFTLSDGAKKDVQMMNRTDKMAYFKGSNFQAVMLPYQDKRLQMCVFLPDQKVGIDAFIASFTEKNWSQWKTQFHKEEGSLGLPKFKIEYKTELSEPLKAAGMPCAFDDKCADFKNMLEEPAIISRVIHKTFIEVNEKGTEAAAATAVEMSTTSARMDPPEPFNMVCDRPFVIAIRDGQTNAVLFLGAIVDPN